MWFYICLLVAVFAARCEGGTVQNNKQKLIYGGSPLPITDAPYMAQYVEPGCFCMCGANIIHKKFLISAAHCYKPSTKKYILVGSNKVMKGERYDIKETIIHPEYNYTTLDNDVLVIMLSRPLQFSDSVQPIQMAQRDLALNSGDMLMTMGFGISEEFNISPILLSVKLPFVTNKDCSEILKNTDLPPITKHMMCAGGIEGEDSCQGDSGGPLVHNNLLVGIVSFGDYPCANGHPGVYTRVSAVRDFIDTTVDKLNNVYE